MLQSETAIALQHKTTVDKNPDRYIAYNGMFDSIEKVKLICPQLITKFNPVPVVATTVSEYGKIICSSSSVVGIPQHVFYPYPESSDMFNTLEQWFCTKENLNDTQYIGYEFFNEEFFLNEVQITARIGTQEAPAKKGPMPKSIRIEGLLPGNTWDKITEDMPTPDWKLLTPKVYDFDNKITTKHKGYRIVISGWKPGEEPDMYPGLFRVMFYCTPATKVRIPHLYSPHPDYIYVQEIVSIEEKNKKLEDTIRSISSEVYNDAYDQDVTVAKADITKLIEFYFKEIKFTSSVSNKFLKDSLTILDYNVVENDFILTQEQNSIIVISSFGYEPTVITVCSLTYRKITFEIDANDQTGMYFVFSGQTEKEEIVKTKSFDIHKYGLRIKLIKVDNSWHVLQ